MKNWRYWVWLLLLCGWLHAEELLQVGDKVPEFPATAEWHFGGEQKLHDFAGKKALALYFASPGCPSCDEFAPHIYRLLLKNADALRVIMVSPTMYSSADVASYVARRQLGDYPVMRDADNSFAPRFIGKIDKFPYLAIVSADGKLAWFGRAKFHAQITEEINRALGKNAPEAGPGLLENSPAFLLAGAAVSHALNAPLKSPAKDCAALADVLQKREIAVALCPEENGKITVAGLREAWKGFVSVPEKPVAEKDASGETGEKNARAPRKLVFFYSGDAAAEVLDAEKSDILLRLADGNLALSALVKEMPADAELTVIIDSMHADRFAGMSAKDADDFLFPDIIKPVGQALPGVGVMLAAARWDMSLLADENAGGTLFAKTLAEELAKEKVPGAAELWRVIRDRMADCGRISGVQQSPFYIKVPVPETVAAPQK